MRTSTIFKSRWMALVWAAGVIWIAYDIAESSPRSAAPTNNMEADQPTNAASEILKGF